MKSTVLFFLPLSALLPQVSKGAFAIDFRNGIWDHSVSGISGAPTNSVGWARQPSPQTRGYPSGRTEVETGVFLTVTTQFLGTATAGTDNLTFDPVATPGFAFQNAGTGDRNTETMTASGPRTNLANYQRIDFFFSEKVTLDSLQLLDIDTTTSSGNQAWRDTVALELWQGSAPLVPGNGINPTISLPSNTRLATGLTTTDLPFAYANELGNFTTSGTPTPADRNGAIFSYDQQGVDGFSIYLWNRGRGTGGKHAVVLQATGSRLTVVPEPSTALLGGLALGLLLVRRR